jgi:hypothetical protein
LSSGIATLGRQRGRRDTDDDRVVAREDNVDDDHRHERADLV